MGDLKGMEAAGRFLLDYRSRITAVLGRAVLGLFPLCPVAF